jgi:adenosine kinase
MNVVLTGSVAYDYLMTFPGRFSEHILADRLDRLSLSFLVDSLERRPGGIAANIAYTLALLGERPVVMATVGDDFAEERAGLEAQGVDTSGIRIVEGSLTASFFVNTDQVNSQIASFFTGAMAHAAQLRFADLSPRPDLALISPNDPTAMRVYVLECRELGIPYFYDPSQQIVRLDAETLQEGLRFCKALFVNDYEMSLLEARTGFGLPEILEHADFVAVTRGEAGVEITTREARIHVPAVPPETVVDPTGVGDSFRGGFLKGYIHGLSLERCGQMGILAATYCLENRGPQGHRYDLPSFVARFRRHFDDAGELDRLL